MHIRTQICKDDPIISSCPRSFGFLYRFHFSFRIRNHRALCSYVLIHWGMLGLRFLISEPGCVKANLLCVCFGSSENKVFSEQMLSAALSHLRCVKGVVLIKQSKAQCNKSEAVITGKNEEMRLGDLGALLNISPWMPAWPHLCHYSDK